MDILNANKSFADLLDETIKRAQSDSDVRRRLRFWLTDCIAHTLHVFEARNAGSALRNLIVATRAYERGVIDAAAWQAALAAAKHNEMTAWATALADDSPHSVPSLCQAAAFVGHSDSAEPRQTLISYLRKQITVAPAFQEELNWQRERLLAWLSPDQPNDWPLSEALLEPQT